MLHITLWDNDIERIHKLDTALHQALRNRGLKARVDIMSEPPLLARMGLLNTLPVLEINGLYWRYNAQTGITVEALEALLKRISGQGAQDGAAT